MARKPIVTDDVLGDDKPAPLEVPEDAAGIPVPDLSHDIPAEALPSLEETEAALGGGEAAGLDEVVIPDAEPKPRRRHRRTRTKSDRAPGGEEIGVVNVQPTESEIEDMGRVLGLGFRVLSRLFAAKRGAHWALHPEEEQELGLAWSRAAAPYFHMAGKYIPLATAVVATAGIIAPRLDMDAQRGEHLPVGAGVRGPAIVE